MAYFRAFLNLLGCRLTFAELGRATGGFETVLFPLLHSGVAGQKTGGLQGGAVLRVHRQQSPGNAVTDGAGLAGDAAAGDGADDVHLAHHVGGDQGLTDQELQGVQAKVIIDVPAVDDDGAGSILIDTNPGDGGLPPTGAVGILSLAFVHVVLLGSMPFTASSMA